MHRSVSKRWLQFSRWLLCTIAIAAPLWGGLVLPAVAQAQAQTPAPAADGQGGGPSTVWLLLLLLLVVLVVVFWILRSGRRAPPPVKKGLAAKGWFDPAGCLYRKV